MSAALPKTNFTRQLPSGSRWTDPRQWISFAYTLEGKSEEDASLQFPDPTGNVTSRAVSDLEAYEHVLEILKRAYNCGRQDIACELGRVHGKVGHVCAFLGDVSGALRHYDRSSELLATGTDLQDHIDLATLLNTRAIALQKTGRASESVRACDEALAFWRQLKRDPPTNNTTKSWRCY